MAQHQTGFKQSHQPGVAAPQMIDPDGGIDKNHAAGCRLLRAGLLRRRPGAEALTSPPPSRARRRAALRSIRACRASCKITERSVVPAAALAALNSFSSSVTVVRMITSMVHCNCTSDNASFDAVFNACASPSPVCQRYEWRPEKSPNAIRIGRRTVSLPLSPKLTDTDVERVIAAVHGILRQRIAHP
ncbi:MAG TPA: DegT/DnrJ/EryC1/StrS family aminotransferase [Rhodanobacteraceae bacterium]|nr:DegT/DnrJ/EryC1/StrS family aminotransferase [Rhodanobacteraceae bacterium]